MLKTAISRRAITATADLKRYVSGSDLDVHPRLHGPVLDLAGSSAEPSGLQAMVDVVRGCSDCDAKLDRPRAQHASFFIERFVSIDPTLGDSLIGG